MTLTAFPFLCFLYAFVPISSACCFVVNNHVLVGQHFTRLTDIDWLGCMQACIIYDRCYSYNFCSTGTGVCELNHCWLKHQRRLVYSNECIFQQLETKSNKVCILDSWSPVSHGPAYCYMPSCLSPR